MTGVEGSNVFRRLLAIYKCEDLTKRIPRCHRKPADNDDLFPCSESRRLRRGASAIQLVP